MNETGWSVGPAEARPRFHGTAGAMAPVVLKGLALTLLTLGVYRFWFVTNVRRFLWGGTEIDGDRLEYAGRGIELFLGFLVALAVVAPLSAAIQFGALVAGPSAQAVLQPLFSLGFVVLAQFALFRARRYRLTRTVWRGVRFQQSGSGFVYAARSIGWGLLAIVSIGLLYPFMRASLERYKMENTWFGDQKASFDATGRQLFRRGVLLWLIAMVTVLGPLALVGRVVSQHQSGDAPSGDVMIGMAAVGAGLAIAIALVVILPLYQAIEFRWWAQGSRIGETRVTTDLGLFAFLRIYLGFGLLAVVCLVAIGAVAAALGYASGAKAGGVEAGPAFAILFALSYFAAGVAVAAVWQIFGARLIWKRSFESVTIAGLGRLMAAQSTTPPANAFGEGVADALDFGGF
ncbi:YjgN family protein [Hansschlegelia plantiphila]|uniref:Membrane protein n=1 Tax=Hansschlegelia plantiphila TaxID=374655 RepID=A0A9W6MUG2_9HYPH|nr:DUF898 family protein [Hansschlegelia plantiphila]GLK66791.1 membrane protein [Hansschlegelia plantiphila]